MGRILRKKRVGNEDSENAVRSCDVAELKSSKAYKKNNFPINGTTGSSLKTQKRMVLMDKTNALKQKDEAKGKIDATAPNLGDAKKFSRKPNKPTEKLGKVTRRRRSSKENDKKPRISPQDENELRPLGDKTNSSEPKKLLVRTTNTTTGDDKGVKSKDSKPSSEKETVSSDENNISNSESSECSARKCPPRNAAKFGDGWISALRSSRTSKESDTESRKPPSPKTKSHSLISSPVDETSPPPQNKRARRGAKYANSGKELRVDVKSKENVTSSPIKRGKRGVAKRGDSSSQHQKCGTLSAETNHNSEASHDEEDTKQLPVTNESPLRKLPPRNAAKYEKGWIASLQRSRNSKEIESALKSPQKGQSSPLDDRTNNAKEIEKPGSGEHVKTGKENAISRRHSSKSEAVSEESPSKSEESGDETDLQKAPERRLGRRISRLDSSAHDASVKETYLEVDPMKTGEPVATKPRRLNNFESRMAAKLGMDMTGSVSGKKPQDADKSPKKPAKETSLRRLRKRGVDQKIKNYAESEESEYEIFGKSSSTQGSKTSRKSPVKPSAVSHEAKLCEPKNIKPSSAPSGVLDGEAPSAVVGHKKDTGPASESSVNCGKGTWNDMKSSVSNSSNSTLHEPQPGCSRDSEFSTPLRSTGTSKMPSVTKKSPLVAPSSSLFSIFKKPETPRRNSLENKIFLSGAKSSPPAEANNKKQLPVYGNPNMTPLKRTSALPQDKKEELYDFEVDENEPKPKKKHKPIMKIQRMRAVKRKKPKVYEADPETERRVLKNLDLSPSVFEEFRAAKKKKIENAAGVVTAQLSQPSHSAEAAGPSDEHPPDTDAPDDHDMDLDGGPMSSPCRDYGQSTPMRTDAPSMFMDESRDKFGRLSAKVYSPVKSKDSPIPVLMEEYNNDPVRRDDSSRRSVVSNISCASGASGNSIYQNDLDVSASTPVKFNKNCSASYVRPTRKPLELNISNCFGFDEPEMMEEPLVSPIKSTVHVPAHTAPVAALVRPVPILKSKPPVMLPPPAAPAVDVDQVIKQLRFEVGDNSSANNSANISVYDDSEITLKNKSPIKRYFQRKDEHKKKSPMGKGNNSTDRTTLGEINDSFSPIPVAPKVPRLSYERPDKLRKKKVIEPIYKEASECESSDDSEESDVECEPVPAEDIFKPTKNKYVAKKEAPKKKDKGMTKKEEEELEKWAQMFNSQCSQIDGFGLVVE